MSVVPESRIQQVNGAAEREDGTYVLYWMTAYRRLEWNFALQRAVDRARDLGVGLVILEALRCDYRWASDRLHRFVLEGMADHRKRLDGSRVRYLPYVEPEKGAGKGLLEALAGGACLVVTDDFPCFFLPKMVDAAGDKLDVRLEMVDSNGLLPMRAAPRVFPTAHGFRSFLQKELPKHLDDFPREHPLQGAPLAEVKKLPAQMAKRWPTADLDALLETGGLDDLPLDHDVPPCPDHPGGGEAARSRLERFLEKGLDLYAEERNDPDAQATSRLSPYLHFGHISSHEIFTRLAQREGWSREELSEPLGGKRRGWWGMSEAAEGFLDQFVTWRELGFNMCWQRDDYDRYESLPDWARETLEEHEEDERPETYTKKELEEAATGDEIWNAAQRELRVTGGVHNYLRMLWGKKVLQWSETPKEAIEILIHLNNKYALDGRNPNSYSGIFWCFGRYDRAWGPERPIFGKVRYMTSDSTRRKLKLKRYLERWGDEAAARKSLFD